jgi:cyclopropane-fatty-acyl-phospholipid synthase
VFHANTQTSADGEEYQQKLQAFVDELKGMPVAVQTLAANEQHYEVRVHVGQWQYWSRPEVLIGSNPLTHSVTPPQVPTDYFLRCLGKRLKYSSCLYPHAETTLDEAEEAMLRESCPDTAACRSSAMPHIPASTY